MSSKTEQQQRHSVILKVTPHLNEAAMVLGTPDMTVLAGFAAGFSWNADGVDKMIQQPLSSSIGGAISGFVVGVCAKGARYLMPKQLQWLPATLLFGSTFYYLLPRRWRSARRDQATAAAAATQQPPPYG